MEQGIGLRYLERLCDAYAEFFEAYDGAPVFAVDNEDLDPANREADLLRLIARLERFDGRRDFFGTQVDVGFD